MPRAPDSYFFSLIGQRHFCDSIGGNSFEEFGLH
jgi:hypothetical protein